MTDEELIGTLWSGEVTLSTVAAAAVRIKELIEELSSWEKSHSDACENWRDVYVQRENELKDEIAALTARVRELEGVMETLRPVWAQGWSGESMAAQASATALAEIKRQVRDQALEDATCTLDHFHTDDTHTTAAVIWQDEILAMKGNK